MKSTFIKLILAAALVVGAIGAAGEKIALARDCTQNGGCRDFVVGELRADLSEVYWAMDYRVSLKVGGASTAPPGKYTTGWLGFDLQPNPNPPNPCPTYQCQFSQVGIKADTTGVYWFVYAEPGVTCLIEGTQKDSRTCEGNVNQYISAGSWSYVELVTYLQGYWIARVYEPNGTAHDVAQISSGSARTYDAQATFEEAYVAASDPHYTGQFFFSHPQ